MKKILVVLATLMFSTQLIAETKEHDIDGYTTYEDAYNALKGNSNAEFVSKDGWTVVNIDEGNDFIVWTFTPESHAAHPAVVKRTMVKKDEAIYIDMRGICDADKIECDKLFAQFEEMNTSISNQLRSKSQAHE